MKGSEKQIAWAEQLIEERRLVVAERAKNAEFVPEYRNGLWEMSKWESARDIITAVGGARAWIDLRNVPTEIIIRCTAAINDMPAPAGKSEKQAAFGQAMRLAKALVIYNVADHRRIPAEIIGEELRNVDAKTWIEGEPEEIWCKVAGKCKAAKRTKEIMAEKNCDLETAKKIYKIEKIVSRFCAVEKSTAEEAVWQKAQECAAKDDMDGALATLQELAKMMGRG